MAEQSVGKGTARSVRPMGTGTEPQFSPSRRLITSIAAALAILLVLQLATAVFLVILGRQVREHGATIERLASEERPKGGNPTDRAPIVSEDLAKLQELKLEKLYHFHTALNPSIPWHQRGNSLKALMESDPVLAVRACGYIVDSADQRIDADSAKVVAMGARMLAGRRQGIWAPKLVRHLLSSDHELRVAALESLVILSGMQFDPPPSSASEDWRRIHEKFSEWSARQPWK